MAKKSPINKSVETRKHAGRATDPQTQRFMQIANTLRMNEELWVAEKDVIASVGDVIRLAERELPLFPPLAAEEGAYQRELMLNTLMRSRAVFATIHGDVS